MTTSLFCGEKMKLIVILFGTIAACSAATTKTSTRTITTLKTTTPKSTTRKSSVTTTVSRIATTTKPTTNPAVYSFCRDTNSSAATGKIQLNQTSQTNSLSSCVFDIVASPGKQIQISCSVVSFNSYDRRMIFLDATESDWPKPVPNKIYYSMANTLSVYSDFLGSDEFECQWNTTSIENTNQFKLCRHGQASSANGTIQPMLAGNSSSNRFRHCSFSIVAPPGYQIEFSCSTINLTSYYYSIFQVDGTTAILHYDNEDVLETNQTYFSTAENEVVFTSDLGKDDWIDCKWATSPRENKTDFKLCRDGEATSAVGTITPTGDVKMPSGGCAFLIEAPPDQRIEISCTAVNITQNEYFIYLKISGIVEYYEFYEPVTPVINQVYHSDSTNKVLVSSRVSQLDWFSCQWAIKPAKENVCGDSEARSDNGTITPLMVHSEETSYCSFSIKAPPEKQIQISCSALDIDTSSYVAIDPIVDNYFPWHSNVLNRVFYSSANYLNLEAKLNSSDDWFNCSWSIVPKPITTNFKLCRDAETTSPKGTIQPLVENSDVNIWERRYCSFTIRALPFQQIKFSCSFLKLIVGKLVIIGVFGGDRESNPLLYYKYYSTDNYLRLETDVGVGDWFSCKWTTVPMKNSTAKSLAQLPP